MTSDDSRRRIAIFSALAPPSIGGVEKYTINLATELTAQGHDVTVVTSQLDDSPSDEITPEGFRIVRLPCRPLLNGRLPLPKGIAASRRALDGLSQKPFDSIMVNTRFYPHSLIGVRFAQRQGIRPIVLDHGSAYLTLGNPLIDLVIKAYEHAITSRIKRGTVDFYGVSTASTTWLITFGIKAKGVLNNSINAEEFLASASARRYRDELSIPDDAFLVAFTGRLAPEKGVTSLLDAAKALEDDNVHFVLAGDGPLMQALREQKPANFHLLGRCAADDIAALLIEADAFCLPTRSEGFSTSLLEAATCACAPIITPVGGVAELIPSDEFGIVIEDAKPETIVTAIRELTQDRQECKRKGERLQSRVRSEFSWAKTAERVLAALDNARRS